MDKIDEQELKEQFIKYFGQQKWDEEEFLGRLRIVEFALANYLEVEPIPVVIEDMVEDSRYYVKENYIAISSKFITNEVEALKCLCHEYKHYHQLICVTYNDRRMPLIDHWKEELFRHTEDVSDSMMQYIEIDAFAFTKYIINKWFDIQIYHPNVIYDEILSKFIQKYYS